MNMLHYPDSLLSCLFFNHPYRIGFISVLFNTLREVMQALGFAGAGKQCTNLNEVTHVTSSETLKFDSIDVVIKKSGFTSSSNEKVVLKKTQVHNQIKYGTAAQSVPTTTFEEGKIRAKVILPVHGYTAYTDHIKQKI